VAHRAPAATTGEPRRGLGAFHATLIDDSVTSSATRPSEHGIHTRWPNQAVPPQAPAQTERLAICPPTPPIWPALRRYATPSFPIPPTPPLAATNPPPPPPHPTPSPP